MRLTQTLLQMCGLKGSPSDLPYSTFWMLFICVSNFLLHFSSGAGVPDADGSFVFALFLSYFFLLGGIYLILKLRKIQVRMYKTTMAYLGTELVMLLSVLPTLQQKPLILMMVIVWSFSVKSYVLRLAMNVPKFISVLIAINLEIFRYIPFMIFFFDELTQQGAV